MRTSALLALSYLSTAVRAGGYQGCLERVWLYQAYEIDGLNAPDDQTLGFKCTRFDEKKKVCVGDWVPCKPKTGPGDRCSYDDFISHLGKALMARGWRVPETGEIDTEATARKCFEVYTKRVNKVKNFPPYVVGKGQIEFNDLIKMVKDVVNKAYREKGTEDNKHLWESFDETTDKILIARTGDHGPFLLENAAKHEQLKDVVTIKKQNLGRNPVADPPADRETLDWTATADEAKRSGVADVDERIDAFRADFYKKGTKGAEHLHVINSYQKVVESKDTCRG